ncbi:hypothetical protein K466DRAFT_598681 [Polyporus arcularius HHB13444]|uniref:Uncharacterized protein n=1 Tax=Polyporus arcularius HHB13444 TaxID=1314778 RepID=A0A5C3PFK4_9APHY|nr:hypothetical protein K466DRAFT_598681 [Polyporus arcularius HHB13444]
MFHRTTIAGRLCLISADAITILMTWYTAIRMGVLRRGPYWSRPSFWQIMFRDAFTSAPCWREIRPTYCLRSAPTDFDPVYYVSTFTEPATAVLVC